MNNHPQHITLSRELGLFSAIMIGLGSIVGTGIFVSIGIAASITGPPVILAIVLAAIIAMCNAFSSAQLAANHAVSGGTYEYGYRYLHPSLGFTAGWMFLCAKTASAATAALGFAGYFIHLLNLDINFLTPIAVCISILLNILILSGLKQTNRMNTIIVSITLIALMIFISFGLFNLLHQDSINPSSFFPSSTNKIDHFFYATALMFVAYTGYGRIATLGEEVKNPHFFIPRAIIITLIISAILYLAVGLAVVGNISTASLHSSVQNNTTPLEVVAHAIGIHGLSFIIAIGACTSMLGVLLNLMLGLSRVGLAMGRQGDLPPIFARISNKNRTPSAAVLSTGVVIISLTLIGNVEITWAFSAFTVLIYYSITNLAALRLPKANRLYHPIFAMSGLIACLFLAWWVPVKIWLTGLGLIIAGLIWHTLAQQSWHHKLK